MFTSIASRSRRSSSGLCPPSLVTASCQQRGRNRRRAPAAVSPPRGIRLKGQRNYDWWEWSRPRLGCVGAMLARSITGIQDLRLLVGLGFNSYRFSIEWSRIEPEDGEFSKAELDHYRRMCAILPRERPRRNGHPASLHHPAVGREDGRLDRARDRRSVRADAERVVKHLGDVAATRWCTFNEPNMVATIRLPRRPLRRGGQGDRAVCRRSMTSSSTRTTRRSRS